VKINPERVEELESTLKHDVIAFLAHIEEQAGEASRFVHFGLTSSDILDTAFAIQLKEASKILLEDISLLLNALKEKAFQFKDQPVTGRTHGIHAEPVTFGLIVALWFDEMRRNENRLKSAAEGIQYGKLSGAVGTYAFGSPELEKKVLERLGLNIPNISNQIIQRDRHADFFSALSITGSTLEKIAMQIRHFQRTEIGEVFEPFTRGQRGSSAMPHKRNPVLCENICGLARLLRSYAAASMENIALWHERDISHSSVERIIAPDAVILLDFMLNRISGVIKNLDVRTEKMLENLKITQGLIFSEALLLCLIRKGVKRQDAYGMIQRNAMKSLEEKAELPDLLKKDPDIMKLLSEEEIERSFSMEHHLRHVDDIFKRVFK
jgi:adenylosuccinate lyase